MVARSPSPSAAGVHAAQQRSTNRSASSSPNRRAAAPHRTSAPSQSSGSARSAAAMATAAGESSSSSRAVDPGTPSTVRPGRGVVRPPARTVAVARTGARAVGQPSSAASAPPRGAWPGMLGADVDRYAGQVHGAQHPAEPVGLLEHGDPGAGPSSVRSRCAPASPECHRRPPPRAPAGRPRSQRVDPVTARGRGLRPGQQSGSVSGSTPWPRLNTCPGAALPRRRSGAPRRPPRPGRRTAPKVQVALHRLARPDPPGGHVQRHAPVHPTTSRRPRPSRRAARRCRPEVDPRHAGVGQPASTAAECGSTNRRYSRSDSAPAQESNSCTASTRPRSGPQEGQRDAGQCPSSACQVSGSRASGPWCARVTARPASTR